jgi:hypothetical protein
MALTAGLDTLEKIKNPMPRTELGSLGRVASKLVGILAELPWLSFERTQIDICSSV